MIDLKPQVLIVDDELTFRDVMARELTRANFTARAVASGQAAIRELGARSYDVLLLDINMPDLDGLQVLKAIREQDYPVEVVVLTGHGSIPDAVEAMRLGAYDFLTKPCEIEVVEAVCRKAAEKAALLRSHQVLRRSEPDSQSSIQGNSPSIQQLRQTLQRAAASELPVLILGETGTGKELAARALHAQSTRRPYPFVAVNCAGLNKGLLESELFGHEKGAFTGAHQAKAGLFESGERGTVFLDEIGEMSPELQASLLRAVQFKEIRRVGATQSKVINVRIVAATNRDLKQEVQRRGFREDLYYRLQGLVIAMPALRERKEDIPILAEQFLASCPAGKSGQTRRFSPGGMKALLSYSWPGNVRELQNVIERLCLLAQSKTIQEEEVLGALYLQVSAGQKIILPDSLEEAELAHIHRILAECDGNKTEAAKRLGISLKTLYNKLQKSR